jgi:2-(1,2-epoxy-1,2-dihydrophenyl)acetyl-CoA isomerase
LTASLSKKRIKRQKLPALNDPAKRVAVPRPSALIVYFPVMARFGNTPVALLTSSTPAVMLPFPSACKLPAMLKNPKLFVPLRARRGRLYKLQSSGQKGEEMAYRRLHLERKDSVGRVTLNRPEAYNALNLEMARELFDAALELDESREIRVIVLTGAGKAFCAGGDVKEFVEQLTREERHLKELTAYLHMTVSRLVRSQKPVLVAVNGVAAGGGMSLAMAGDIVVAAESARFTMAYARIGVPPDGSSSYFLPRLVGLRRAMELYLLNRPLTAREAFEWGLVTRVESDMEFPRAVESLARKLADGPTLAFGAAKLLFHHATHESLETQMEMESEAIARAGQTEDFRRAVAAFAERNKRSG